MTPAANTETLTIQLKGSHVTKLKEYRRVVQDYQKNKPGAQDPDEWYKAHEAYHGYHEIDFTHNRLRMTKACEVELFICRAVDYGGKVYGRRTKIGTVKDVRMIHLFACAYDEDADVRTTFSEGYYSELFSGFYLVVNGDVYYPLKYSFNELESISVECRFVGPRDYQLDNCSVSKLRVA